MATMELGLAVALMGAGRHRCLRVRFMLQKLDSEIRECYQHAMDCSRSADESRDSSTKQEFLEMAKRWLSLAHSYEFTEQLLNFT
jgi:hypothetical protein